MANNRMSTSMSAHIVDGDRACERGDLRALAREAELLAVCVAEPLRCELLDVARRCLDDRARATAGWLEVRAHLHERLPAIEPSLRPSA